MICSDFLVRLNKVMKYLAIIFCLIYIIVPLTSCSQLEASELDTEIIGVQRLATNKAAFEVLVKKTAMTDDKTYYKIGVSVGDKTYMNEGTKFMKSALDAHYGGYIVSITVQDNLMTNMFNELDKIYTEKRESAQREYDKFIYEHSSELFAGAVGLGPQAGVSYEKYQKLMEEEKRLKAAIDDPPDINYDSFCRNFVQVVTVKEPISSP